MDKRCPASAMLVFTLVVLGLLLACPGGVSAAQILTNPGFESGALTPWFQDRDFGGVSDWATTNADAHSGTFSAQEDGNKELRQNITATPTSAITSISFFAKHPDAAVTQLFVDLFYSDLTDTGFLVDTVGTDWNFFDVTSHLEPGKTLVAFSIFGNSVGVTLFDDASITTADGQIPEPSTLLLLTAGLAGLTGLAWSRKQR